LTSSPRGDFGACNAVSGSQRRGPPDGSLVQRYLAGFARQFLKKSNYARAYARRPARAPARTRIAGLIRVRSTTTNTTAAISAVVQPVTAPLAKVRQPARSKPIETGESPD